MQDIDWVVLLIHLPETVTLHQILVIILQKAQWKHHQFETMTFIDILSLVNILTSSFFILLHEKFLQFDWLKAVLFQLNLKYLHVKIAYINLIAED